MLPWLHIHQTNPTQNTMATFNKTVDSIIDGITKDAESVGVIDHVLDNYNLCDSTERRMARIYIQAERDRLTTEAKAAKVASMSKPPTTTTQDTPTMIEVVVDSKGKTIEVINHGIADVSTNSLTPTTKAMTQAAKPAFTTTATTVATTAPAPKYSIAHLDTMVSSHCDDFATYGNLLSYPVLKPTGTDDKGDITYAIVRGQHQLQAYAFLKLVGLVGETFNAVLLTEEGKVDGTYEIDSSYLADLVEESTFAYQAPATPAKPAAKPAKAAKAVNNEPDNETSALLVPQIQDAYNAPMMKLKALVNAYLAATAQSGSKLGSTAKKADVQAAATAILTQAGLPAPEAAPAKTTAAASKPAAKAGTIPTSDVMKAAAKAAKVDVSNVNFRSSTQRAALAVQLGLM